jgi:indolepyruvate ferredoxin oxidoreductase beta subunit
MIAPLFSKGRHVETTSLRWFLVLRALAKFRRIRRRSLRFHEEQERIERWLTDVCDAASAHDLDVAVELVRCQRLIKGYGDTFERGLKNFNLIRTAFLALPREQRTAQWLAQARAKALADDRGDALSSHLALAS